MHGNPHEYPPDDDGCPTYAQVVARAAKLQQFKDFVHNYLDNKDVPKFENQEGPHSKEGCRIGDRLDWIFMNHMRNLSFLIFYMRSLGYELYGNARAGSYVWQTFVRSVPVTVTASYIEC